MPVPTPEAAKADDQVWALDVAGRHHRVASRGSFSRRLEWLIDGELVVERKSADGKVQLKDQKRPEIGVVEVRFSSLGAPRRATLIEPDPKAGEGDLRALAGVGGIDLEPVPGSRAAVYEDRVRAHPRRHAFVATLSGVAKVLVPLILAALIGRLALSVPWPDWDLPNVPFPDWAVPSIPLPDLPDLPDLPAIPWPQWSAPGWLTWILDRLHFVWPVILAFVLARSEIRRRRKQDQLRDQRLGRSDTVGKETRADGSAPAGGSTSADRLNGGPTRSGRSDHGPDSHAGQR